MADMMRASLNGCIFVRNFDRWYACSYMSSAMVGRLGRRTNPSLIYVNTIIGDNRRIYRGNT